MLKRIKHIKTKYKFIKDKTEDGTISFHYVPTDKMAADIFTISLPVSKVEKFRIVLMRKSLYTVSSILRGAVRKSIKL